MDKHIFSNYPDFIKKKIIIIDTIFLYHFIKKMDKHIFSNYPDFIKKKIIIIDTRFFYHFIKKIGVCPSSSYRMLQHYVLRTTGLLGHGDGR